MPQPAAQLIVPSHAFAQLPQQLRDDLLGAFARIVQGYAERRWEPAELNGGKLSPSDMVGACRELEKHMRTLRSVRIQIPRTIVALYEIRNNRNVGHLGGEIDRTTWMPSACCR